MTWPNRERAKTPNKPNCALEGKSFAIAGFFAAILAAPPGLTQTYTVDKNGKFVLQEPLIAAGQITAFYNSAGRPIRPIEVVVTPDSDEERSANLALAERQPGQYSKYHRQVIQNVQMVARRYQRDPTLSRVNYTPRQWTALFQAMIKVESNFNPKAHSHANAYGLAQIIPETARYLRVDVHDPIQNLDGGARYLLEQIGKFADVKLALAAYNAGPEAVLRHQGIPPYKETQNHVRKVMAEYSKLIN